MAKGIDTNFLVEVEVTGHPGHTKARALLGDLLAESEPLALAPQVLAEFVHVVTDSRRFEPPLTPLEALARAELWWTAREVSQVFPTEASTGLFLRWMADHKLGRKRVLDTQLAATYHSAGVRTLITTNPRDYAIFDCFRLLVP